MSSRDVRGPNKMSDLGTKSKWVDRGAPEDPGLRRMILGATIEIAIQALFKGFTYTFDGKIYHQQDGGPTGTRIAMAVGQLLMEWIMDKLRKIFSNSPSELEIKLFDLILYIDDGRTFCSTMPWGTRF